LWRGRLGPDFFLVSLQTFFALGQVLLVLKHHLLLVRFFQCCNTRVLKIFELGDVKRLRQKSLRTFIEQFPHEPRQYQRKKHHRSKQQPQGFGIVGGVFQVFVEVRGLHG